MLFVLFDWIYFGNFFIFLKTIVRASQLWVWRFRGLQSTLIPLGSGLTTAV